MAKLMIELMLMMHLLSSILSLLFVCLTITPGKTQIFRNSGKISNSNDLQGNYSC